MRGERAAGIIKNAERIESMTGTAKYRVPDVLNRSLQYIGEVKNVANLAYTNQLRDFVLFAQANHYRFELFLRKGANISGELEELVHTGAIILTRLKM